MGLPTLENREPERSHKDGEAEMKSDPDLLELSKRAQANLSVPALYEAAIRRGEGIIAAGGPLVVRPGAGPRGGE